MSAGTRIAFVSLAIAGVLAGAAGGAIYHASMWLKDEGAATPAQLGSHLEHALLSGDADLLLAILIGALIGVVAVAAAFGATWFRTGLSLVSGMFLGALGGVITFALGDLLIRGPQGPGPVGYLLALGDTIRSGTPIMLFCLLIGTFVGMVVVRYSWSFAGVVTYIALFAIVSGYLFYTLTITLPQVPLASMPISLALFVAEAASLLMVLIYSFYNIDVTVRRRWRRQAKDARFSRYYIPKVAFHVATYNEPPEIVLGTLHSLMALDYPRDRFVVMVLDDSTDPAAREPVEAFCREHGLMYHHRTDRRGYKAGALNEGLKVTPRDVELVAIIDADYQVVPEYLIETVGYFIDPDIAFVQTPQAYRNTEQSFLTKHYNYANTYFYKAILPSRNEENTIIFCGTMGIIRRHVLEEVGGWGEQYVAEDAELSARILEHGYTSMYVNKTYGRGLIPATYEGYKKQAYRWAFGGVQILKGHFWKFWWSRLSVRQSFDFGVASLHWFNGVWMAIIAFTLAALAWSDLLGLPLITYHYREVWLLGLVPFFLLFDGIIRVHMTFKRSLRLPIRSTLRVLGLWFSIQFNNAGAALKALVGVKIPFIRTPKEPTGAIGRGQALARAVQLTPFESHMTVLLWTLALGSFAKVWTDPSDTALDMTRVLLSFWLIFYGMIFAAAPYYAYRSYVTFQPDAPHVESSGAPART